MNIVFITDENYLVPTGTALASILTSNPCENIRFYVVAKKLSEANVVFLNSCLSAQKKNADVSLNFIYLEDEDTSDFPIRKGDHVSIATYYRIFFQKLFPESEDKILFVDGDILCIDSIKSFYETDLTGYSCAVSHDERNDDPAVFARLKYPSCNGYFNAGVMLINLSWWRENDVMQKCVDYIRNHPDACVWHDQDALNHVLNGTVLWTSFRNNFTQGFFFDKSYLFIDKAFYREIDEAKRNPCILHYSSAYKPWHYECNHPLKEKYRQFYQDCMGKSLELTYKLQGFNSIKWKIKRFLDRFNIIHYEDFRKSTI